MNKLIQRIRKNKRIWLTAGVIALLIGIFTITQFLFRYETVKHQYYSYAENSRENNGESEFDEYVEAYKALEEYATLENENAIASMNYTALVSPVTNDEAVQENTVSGNNQSEPNNDTVSGNNQNDPQNFDPQTPSEPAGEPVGNSEDDSENENGTGFENEQQDEAGDSSQNEVTPVYMEDSESQESENPSQGGQNENQVRMEQKEKLVLLSEQGSESSNNIPKPQDENEDSEPTVSSNNMPEPPTLPEGLSEVEVTLYFNDLSSAFLAAEALYEIKNKDLTDGVEPYIPIIQIIADFQMDEVLVCTNPYGMILDLNGHLITFSENAYFNIVNQGKIELIDDAAEIGGMKTSAAYLFMGNGELTFSKGVYLAPLGSIVNSATKVHVLDGQFVYEKEKGLLEEGDLILPVGKVLYPKTLTFRNEMYSCVVLDDPDFMVVAGEEDEQEIFYFATFGEAFENAQKISDEKDQQLVKICIFDDQIVRIAVDNTLVMEKGCVELSNLSFIRDDEFVDSFFHITAGELYFHSITIDGTIYSENLFVSNGALVQVDGGNLHICGTKEHPTIIYKNTVMAELKELEDGDYLMMNGSGVSVINGGNVYVSSCVQIKDNIAITRVTEDNPQGTEKNNVFLNQNAKLLIEGKMDEDAFIGISNPFSVVAGLTNFAYIHESYKEAFLAEQNSVQPWAQQQDELVHSFFDERLKAFVLDSYLYQTYYAVYDEETNEVFWNKDQIMLPEAGVFRIEILLFVAAVYLLLMLGLMIFVKKVPTNRPLLVASLTCLTLSIFVSIFKIVHEKNLARQNREVMEEVIAQYNAPSVDIRPLSIEETVEEVVVEEIENEKTLQVPADGREYIGIIEIEELQILLPILKEYSAVNMKTTPCVYYGSVEDGNLVIVGHNYDTQFGLLNMLNDEDVIHVNITLSDGTKLQYISIRREELEPDDVDRMLSTRCDLTLFTCNYIGDKRITFRLMRD